MKESPKHFQVILLFYPLFSRRTQRSFSFWAMVVRQSALQIFLLEFISIFLLRLIVQLYSVVYIPLQHYIHNEQYVPPKKRTYTTTPRQTGTQLKTFKCWKTLRWNVQHPFTEGLLSWNHAHSNDFSSFDQIWRKQELTPQCHFETSNAQLKRLLSK